MTVFTVTVIIQNYIPTSKQSNKHILIVVKMSSISINNIRNRTMTTNKQKAAVHFCEQWLDVTFNGDINNFKQVSYFLSTYLDDAKQLYDEIKCEYESDLWDLMD